MWFNDVCVPFASVTRGRVCVCVCSPVSGHVITEPDQLITHSADVSFSVAKNRLKQRQDSRVFLLSPPDTDTFRVISVSKKTFCRRFQSF